MKFFVVIEMSFNSIEMFSFLFYFIILYFIYLFIYLFCLFAISWAARTAYGGSQARGRIGAVAAGLYESHSNVGSEAASATYTTAQGNTGSPTH